MALTLADQVGGLEVKCQRVIDLACEMIATLELNKQHFLRDDEPARKILFELIDRWKARLHKDGFSGETINQVRESGGLPHVPSRDVRLPVHKPHPDLRPPPFKEGKRDRPH
jgi:hypothetical protein